MKTSHKPTCVMFPYPKISYSSDGRAMALCAMGLGFNPQWEK